MKIRLILLSVVAASAVACSSTPDIPDQPENGAQYRSTQLEGEETKPAEDTKPSEPTELTQVVKASGPVATVNGHEITAAEFNKEIERVMSTGAVPVVMVNNAAGQIVQKLVDRYLIDESIQKEKVEVDAAEVDAKLEEVRQDFAKAAQGAGKEVTLEELVQQLGITTEELRKSVQQSVAIEKVLLKRGMPASTEKDAKAFYDENLDRFKQPEQVHVRHILITVDREADEAKWTEAKTAAQAIYKEASKKGADFAELAKTKSQGPSAPQGGDLGFVPRGRTVPEFEKASFGLKDGEVSQPVRSPFGWHIIKREGYKAEGQIPFEEVKDQLIARLKAEKIQESLNTYLQELRASAAIEVHNENVN